MNIKNRLLRLEKNFIPQKVMRFSLSNLELAARAASLLDMVIREKATEKQTVAANRIAALLNVAIRRKEQNIINDMPQSP